MRREYFDYMGELMTDKRIHLLMMDLGYPRYDELKGKYPNQVFNTGASEQTALDMAVGIAQSGGIPFTYTITPFYWRGAETIRTYISHENANVKMVAAGVGEEYGVDDGFSHSASDFPEFMAMFKNVKIHTPEDKLTLEKTIRHMITYRGPEVLMLHR